MKAIVLAVILGAAFQAEVHARPESSPQMAPVEEILIKDRGPESWLPNVLEFAISGRCV